MLKLILGAIIILALCSSVYASESFGITPKLCINDYKNCYSSLENMPQIYINDSLLLKIEVLNVNTEWICWDGYSFGFTLTKDNVNTFNTGGGSSQIASCLPKGEKITEYFRLPKYPDAGEDRMGNWKLSNIYLVFNNLKCYHNISFKDDWRYNCNNLVDSSGRLIANDISFNVKKDEVSMLPTGWSIDNYILKAILDYGKWIIGSITLIFFGLIFTTKGDSSRKRKARGWFIFLTIIFAILELIIFILIFSHNA